MKQALVGTLREHRLWEPGERVAIAMSGGLDSTVLGHLLVSTRGMHGAALSVVHVHHGLQSRSDEWAAQVRRWAECHDLPCIVHRAQLNDPSEATARAARFAFFGSLPVDRVALAHHQQDQAETVLINLLRGTGPRGLAGMRLRRDRYVRPLLDVPKKRLLRYARRHGLQWCEDPSNQTDTYLRNRVRQQILPVLESVREGAVSSLARSATLAAEDADLLEQLAAVIPPTVQALRDRPRPLARRVVRRLVPGASVAQVEAVLGLVRAGRGELMLGPKRSIAVVDGDLVVRGAGGSKAG